jgi:hypothetical protein
MVEVQIAPDMKDDLERQKEYVRRQKSKKDAGMGLVFADAFLRGMRDLGYKSPATAIDELIDNSIQASATFVRILFGYEDSRKKPAQIAIVDNGHGMVPDMIYFAVKWGGTHRENDRSGFGRYGYGLPSAAVSIGKRYTVFSKIKGGKWHGVTVDIEALAAMAETGEPVDIPKPTEAEPPEFVTGNKWVNVSQLSSGTVILLENLDRMREAPGWTNASAIEPKLMKHIGVIYRHLIPKVRIYVEGAEVQAVDPLFVMEGTRLHDETPVMAQPVEGSSFETESPSGRSGRVRIRASWLPEGFQLANPNTPVTAKKNDRFAIIKEYNGLMICRAGRQIDCLRANPWTVFQNNDRYVRIEIDFDPELDEFFGITTSKQQITVHDSMWSRLEAAELRKLIRDLRDKYEESKAEHAAKIKKLEGDAQRRASEQAMEESEKYKQKTSTMSPDKAGKAKDRQKREAEEEARHTGRPLKDALKDVERQVKARPYMVDFKPLKEGPFYLPERVGPQRRVIVNTEHPFFTHIYDSPNSNPSMQTALEVLLFVLADSELDSDGDFETFYKNARRTWSERLTDALGKLTPADFLADEIASRTERAEAGEQ